MPSRAQEEDCARLQAGIAAARAGAGTGSAQAFDRAAQRQRAEIERTHRYAAQLGCNRVLGWFGADPSPECRDVEDRLGRMQDNLDRLDSQADDGRPDDGGGRLADLTARYDASCRGGNPGSGPFDDGMPGDPDGLSSVPLNGSIMEGAPEADRPAGHTICVRTCDGGYFPLAPHATGDQLDGLEQLCKASCPNTEARLFTMRGDDLAAATAVDGSSYTDLPAAFKFEKSFAPSCTCKPPNQSWSQALAGAEQLLERGDDRDVTVTPALSDQMAKPSAAKPPPKGKARKAQPATAGAADGTMQADAARAAQAPTAGSESSGIGGAVGRDRVLGRGDGLRITAAGPDGSSRQIRLIVP